MDVNQTPVIKKETKNKIKVEFERADLKTRLKAKFISASFLGKVIFAIFKIVLLVGISYIILYPFVTKISASIMSKDDFADITVRLIPRNPTLDIYKACLTETQTIQGKIITIYQTAFINTFILSLVSALVQMFSCCLIAYGLAKFKFKGNSLIFFAVILTMVIPHSTLQYSMYMNFRYFDIWGIGRLLSGGTVIGSGLAEEDPAWITALNGFLAKIDILPDKIEITKSFALNFKQGTNLINTYMPMVLLSATGLAFKNGLYIFMLRQFFRGVPDSLEESAYIDGSGVFRTFVQIILPMSVPMMITVFIFAFSWQWTDDFYTNLFFPSDKIPLMPDVIDVIPNTLEIPSSIASAYNKAIRGTWGLLIIFPLVIMYLFCQNFIVQGIERSGITGE